MKSTAILLVGLPILLASLPAHGQGGDTAIPPRYEPIKTTKRTRLVQVCGSPEVQPGFGQTGAYAASGNTAVFASSVPAAEETDPPVTHLYIWDLEKNAFRGEIVLAGKALSAIALTPDGSRAVLGIVVDAGQKKKPICSLGLWDLKTGKEVRSFGTPREPIFALAISPDGTRALAGTIGGLSQWDLNLGKETAPFDVPKDKLIAAVAYLPDGKHAITGWGGEIKLWDVATGKDKRTYKPKDAEATIFGLTVSADGKRFASADYDLSARLWETDSGKELGAWRQGAQLRGGPASADLVLSDDAKSVFVSWGFLNPAGGARDSALICRFDAGSAKETWSRTVPLQGTVPARLSAKRLLLGGGANPFCEWDPADGKELGLWGGPKGPITALARDPADTVLSAGNEGVLFRCAADGQQLTTWRAHEQAINALAMNKGRSLLLSASTDKTVKLHDAAKGMPVCTLTGHTGNVTCVMFGDTDSWAASAGDDRTIILWDLKQGKKRHVLEGHADGINALARSPKADWLASASSDNTIRLWPIKSGRDDPDRDPIVLEAHKKPVTCVAFSADGKTLLSAGQDQTVKLWDVAKQEVIREMKGHNNWISAAIFHGDGLVISASDDLTVRLWDTATGKEVDRIDLSTVSDGPRSLLSLGEGEFAVGTSGWVVMRFATK